MPDLSFGKKIAPPTAPAQTVHDEHIYDGVDPVGFDKHFNVVDPDTGEVLGKLFYPSEFCDGIGCASSVGRTHALSFRRVGPLWVHLHCGKPTRAYAQAEFDDVIEWNENAKLPWHE